MRAALRQYSQKGGSFVSQLRLIAQRIRHLPGLESAEGFWQIVRRPYQNLLNTSGYGVSVQVGGVAEVRMPAEFAGGSWEKMEPESVQIFDKWIRTHPGGMILDIGSSIGIFSAIALFADRTTEVLAVDPDLPSLAAVQRMCQYAAGSRLKIIQCFLSDDSSNGPTLADCAQSTDRALEEMRADGKMHATRYLALGDESAVGVPRYTLDCLLKAEMYSNRPLLIKCDVEGAELKVLQGGETLIRQRRPEMLISVHPQALSQYHSSKADVQSFLADASYKYDVIAIDHEEHWWCEANDGSVDVKWAF